MKKNNERKILFAVFVIGVIATLLLASPLQINQTQQKNKELPTTIYGSIDTGALQIEQTQQLQRAGPTIAKANSLISKQS